MRTINIVFGILTILTVVNVKADKSFFLEKTSRIVKDGDPQLDIHFEDRTADAAFENEMLTKHNTYRTKHGVPPLTLNRDLCNYAQQWADQMAATDKFQHRPNRKYGENLWAGKGINTPGKSSVDSWYNEIKLYDWNKPGFSVKTGHFTQVVWKNSKEIGVGKAKSASGWLYVVANYNPPGNYLGQFPKNVPKPIA